MSICVQSPVICPICKRSYAPDLTQQPDFMLKVAQYSQGGLIQEVWPEATVVQREQIMTGICSAKCWEVIYSEEEM